MNKCVVFVFIFNFCSIAFSSNFNWKFSVDSIVGKSIGDDEKKEKVDDWVCTVGSPKEDKFGNEMRRLGCGLKEGGLQAYLLTTCNKDKKTGKSFSENGCLNLQMNKSGSKLVCLSCE